MVFFRKRSKAEMALRERNRLSEDGAKKNNTFQSILRSWAGIGRVGTGNNRRRTRAEGQSPFTFGRANRPLYAGDVDPSNLPTSSINEV